MEYENIHEETFPTEVSIEKYNRDIDDYKQQLNDIQNEIYKKDRIKEALESFVESIKENYETLQKELKKEYERR